MRHGFVKVAAITPKIRVADPVYNGAAILEEIERSYERGAKIMVFPELCLTGYTCGDLFLQETLLTAAEKQLLALAEATREKDALIFVGLPLEKDGRLYNVAAAVQKGKILGFIPKINVPSYGEFYEGRHFAPGELIADTVWFAGEEVPFGANILFETDAVNGLVVACEICEDLWVADSPSVSHAREGATVVVNLSASNETVGKDVCREMLVKSASLRENAAYIYAGAGEGESSQDLVFGGHNMVGQMGTMLAQSKRFQCQTVYADVDIHRILMERRRINRTSSYLNEKRKNEQYVRVHFQMECTETKLETKFAALPFVPKDQEARAKRCDEILSIQSYGLKKRYEHTGCRSAVIGVSGGLDSTLALLVTVRTFDMLGIDRKNIKAVTMPCFGTTDRTYDNACKLARTLGATLMEVDIRQAVTVHFEDIGQALDLHDVTYENGQARERTQVLMDIANQSGALVIGTGDLSELALGWATYNGDHMSMYGVNSGVPKTLIKHLVSYYADTCQDEKLEEVLRDVLDTPVSPELLPPVDGVIAQKTEDLVGPYELHDFFLYHMLRGGFEPSKIYRIAKDTFAGIYDNAEILKWLKTFYRRFFSQQFKRSCLPDGPKVGSVSVSPRGDLRMPSDASAALWMAEMEKLQP